MSLRISEKKYKPCTLGLDIHEMYIKKMKQKGNIRKIGSLSLLPKIHHILPSNFPLWISLLYEGSKGAFRQGGWEVKPRGKMEEGWGGAPLGLEQTYLIYAIKECLILAAKQCKNDANTPEIRISSLDPLLQNSSSLALPYHCCLMIITCEEALLS